MYFVDVKDGVSLRQQSVHHLLNALFQVAPKLRSGQEGAHVHLVNAASPQPLRHVAPLYHGRQPIHQGCFTHTRFAHMQRVVLFLAAQHLYGALQFFFPANKRIMFFVRVVHACNERTPRCLFLIFLVVVAEDGHVVVFIIQFHQFGHEVRGVLAQLSAQQISRIRVLQA